MIRRCSPVLPLLAILLVACAPVQTPQITPAPTSTALPAATLPDLPAEGTIPPTQTLPPGGLFIKVTHSTDVLHRKCDPLEIIFDVTASDPRLKGVTFFFRMKDKASGITSPWSNGETMHPVGGDMYEFIFQASAIPDEARFNNAWLQYQFAGLNRAGESLGRSQIFAEEIAYTPACP